MASASSSIHISGLGRNTLAAMRKQAKALGLPLEQYAKELIEEAIRVAERARTETFDEIFAPVQAQFRASAMSEREFDRLVDQARTRHHRRMTRKKR
jgi:hypothetical protein